MRSDIAQPADAPPWPAIAPYAPNRPAIHTKDGPVSQGTLLARAQGLARHLDEVLPAGAQLANYCECRVAFTVALLGSWLAGRSVVLPPDRTDHTLRLLTRTFDPLVVLAETGCAMDLPDPILVDTVTADGDPPAQAPRLPGDLLAARVFTSGSTGTPEMNDKTFAMLAAGGKTIPAMLTLDRLGRANVVATVPSQHMYGFETTALYALQGGAAAHAGRPMYPADLAQALSDVPAPRVLVTTPTHLRALVDSAVALPPIEHAISATAPLGAALARAAEDRLGAPVREIYGFTEAGSVAGRRTVDGDVWQMRGDYVARTVPGPDGDRALVHCPAVGQDVAFPDVVEVLDGNRIRLKGRAQDLVNVAGKRASLSGLAAQLMEIEGVEDAVFVQPGTDSGAGRVGRLLAFAVAPGWNREALRQALQQRLDPAFVPRRLVLVESLPRNATGKLLRQDLERLVTDHTGRPA
ncbi:MAG: class I adenylate-forming enzyme family protein [Rhodovibrio sp.]|nr:class I adenylate-forming enzyme family protein [Rhodovibrio sp.]